MSGIEYQKIELHSTENLVKDQERIEYEKETAQRLMMENQIPFSIEIEEADLIGSNYRKTGTAYVLNLIVRKEDAEKVIELLDREGGFGYFVDLDETYDPDAEKEETEDENISFVEIPEELKEEEPENLKVESLDDLFEDAADEPKEKKVEQMASVVADPTPVQEKEETISPEPATLPLATEEDSYDLQKELEAKFDELFGPIDDETE